MPTREKNLSSVLAASALSLCVTLISRQPIGHTETAHAALPLGASVMLSTPEKGSHLFDRDDPAVRAALRLQERLRRAGRQATLENSVAAVRERQRLMRGSVRVHFMTESGSGALWVASAQSDPLWVRMMEERPGGLAASLDLDRIEAFLTPDRLGSVPQPIDAVITGLGKGERVKRVHSNGAARPGYVIDVPTTRAMLVTALMDGHPSIQVPLIFIPGRLVNHSDADLGELALLATGHSNFKGSPWGRIANVRKALNQHVHNALVAPGETFSFYRALQDPLSAQGRWELAKVINEGILTLEPGGGICQASTTLFRGILAAGLPVQERRSHSMYVSYYEVGGVGLDATVYKGKPDLTFLNDTGHPIVIQAYDDGDDAYVHLYGTPDGRSVSTVGPYFTATAPAHLLEGGRKLQKNEIGWSHAVTYPDGTVRSEAIVSSYKILPRSIVAKYTTSPPLQETLALQTGLSGQ